VSLTQDVVETVSKIIEQGNIAEVVQNGSGQIVVREVTKAVKIKAPKNG